MTGKGQMIHSLREVRGRIEVGEDNGRIEQDKTGQVKGRARKESRRKDRGKGEVGW